MKKILSLALSATLVLGPGSFVATAKAQQEPGLTPVPQQPPESPGAYEDPVAELTNPNATAPIDDKPEDTPARSTAPNTDSCPFALTPPPAVSTSERLAPGQPAPTPLPPVPGAACGVSVPPGFEVKDDVVSAAWIVADIDSGEIIAAKDPHGRYRPASIIKVLLALVAIEELDLNQTIIASAESAGIVGSAAGLGEGGRYTVEQLLQGLLMASGNDTAHALAQELGGDEETLRKINDKAAEIGTSSTVAATYSGLDSPGMSTSAHDMALVYQTAYRNPVFARIVNTETVQFLSLIHI